MSGRLRSLASWLSSRLWRAVPGRDRPAPLSLPQDEWPHQQPTEWWYLVGQLDATDRGPAQQLGFELTIARVADPLVARLGGWAAVFSFIDPARGRYRVAERRLWPPLDPVQRKTDPPSLRFQIGDGEALARAEDWVLDGLSGRWHLRARLPTGEGVDLDLKTTRPAALFGKQGVVDYGDREAMAWMAWTRIAAVGTAYDGEMVRPVKGLCWMDHQWGAPWLDGYVWKVCSVHLDSGHDVLAFSMVDRAGQRVTARCALIHPDGRVDEVGPEGVHLQDQGPALRVDAAEYRPGTRLVSDHHKLDLTIRPLLLDQRKRTDDRLQAFPIWWEGACEASGLLAGKQVRGRSFVEIAGLE